MIRLKPDISSRIISIICLIIMMALLCGCSSAGSASSDVTADSETIVIGINSFEPYSYLNTDGDYAGIDIDIATEAFARLGYTPRFKIIDWSDRNNLLESGDIDCIWSCFTMTGREDEYNWAGPYLYSYQVVAVRSDSDINSISDLANKRIGVQISTKAAALFLHEEQGDVAIPQMAQVCCFATADELFASIRKGYVDAVAGHVAVINELIEDGDGTYRLLDEKPYHSGLGVAFAKDTHEELVQSLTDTLDSMKKDGTISNIASQYGLDPEAAVWGGDVDE